MTTDLYADLRTFVGQEAGPPRRAADPVDRALIRQFVEVMGDENPIYVDDAAAQRAGRDAIVAPPAMLSTWLMPGYRAHQAARSGAAADTTLGRLLAMLDAAGFTGVVATNDEQSYHREVRLGDQLEVSVVIEDVSPVKQTALGPGHFVTTLRSYRDQTGAVVAEQRLRILRFRPQARADDPALRPKPFVTRDNAFWFAAAREHRLVIQACDACGALRHPPSPSCPTCLSFDWHEVTASGQGAVHSFVVSHHPPAPGFDYPLVVLLVDLDEGTRLVADFAGPVDEVRIGQRVEVQWVRYDEEFTLPQFRPAGGL